MCQIDNSCLRCCTCPNKRALATPQRAISDSTPAAGLWAGCYTSLQRQIFSPSLKGAACVGAAWGHRYQATSLPATGFARSPPLLPFLFCKCFSSHKFLFLEYHNLYTQLWCIISIYRFCYIIFKHKFDSRKTYVYNLYAQLIEE
jgi:hypothetical protein